MRPLLIRVLGVGLIAIAAGCGSSGNKADAGTGGAAAGTTGGSAGRGGATAGMNGATAGAGGAAGTTGVAGTSGAAGTTGAAGTGGAAGTSGAAGLGGAGAGGRGGATAGTGGGGGAQAGTNGGGGHGGTTGAGGNGGSPPCGTNTCGANQYCCQATCGLCLPMGAACPALACRDGGVDFDADTCRAVPQGDSQCSGNTPHFFTCLLSSLPPPCIVVSIGNATDGYCCP